MTYPLPENWYAPENTRKYLSNSQLKAFEECPSRELARQRGEYKPEDKRAFLVGRYVDVALTEPGKRKDFATRNRGELFKEPTLKAVKQAAEDMGYADPPKKKEDMPEFLDRYPHVHGHVAERYADIEQADLMIRAAQEDPQMRAILQGEGQVRMVGEIAGVPFRCILDILNREKKRVVDLKTAKDFETSWSPELRRRIPWYLGWRYDRQMAIYRLIVKQNTGEDVMPLIAALSKQTPPDREIIAFQDNDALDRVIEEIGELVPHVQAWKAGEVFNLGHHNDRHDVEEDEQDGEIRIHYACGKCDHCRATKKTKILVAQNYE